MDLTGNGWECLDFVHGSGEDGWCAIVNLALKKLYKTEELT